MNIMLQRLLTIVFFLLGAVFTTWAQSFNLLKHEFIEDPNDQTANKYIVKDRRNLDEPCPLIKLQTTQKDLVFCAYDGSILKSEPQNEKHPDEIWIWVPRCFKAFKIYHPWLGLIFDGHLRAQSSRDLQSGHTYRNKLVKTK